MSRKSPAEPARRTGAERGFRAHGALGQPGDALVVGGKVDAPLGPRVWPASGRPPGRRDYLHQGVDILLGGNPDGWPSALVRRSGR
jgi:murein DD-endopeptidase MepM/ murein hydrolase activator NlpD